MQRLLTVLAAAALTAGCLGAEAPAASKERAPPGDDGSTPPPAPVRNPNLTAGKRWHFHNYWGLSDNLTLFDGPVQLAPEVFVAGDRPHLGAAVFAPAEGRIVPPETGRITVEVHWNGTLPARPLALAYRSANASAFAPAGPLQDGVGAVNVTEPMADAPHTGVSGWAFRLEAAPDEHGLAVANGTLHVRAVAWLGRPLIIDPPHRDHWYGKDVLELGAASLEGRAVRGPKGVVVHDGAEARTQESVLRLVPPNGTVVPDGAGAILVRLAWASTAPLPVPPDLAVHWSESQTGGAGLAAREDSDAGGATYRILLDKKQADSPYTHRSTWVLDVQFAETGTPAFEGRLTMRAWVAKAADAPVPA